MIRRNTVRRGVGRQINGHVVPELSAIHGSENDAALGAKGCQGDARIFRIDPDGFHRTKIGKRLLGRSGEQIGCGEQTTLEVAGVYDVALRGICRYSPTYEYLGESKLDVSILFHFSAGGGAPGNLLTGSPFHYLW